MGVGSRQADAHPALSLHQLAAQLAASLLSSGLSLCSGEPQVLSGGHLLSLPAARLHDSGTYTCVASSPVGEDRREATLEVLCKCLCAPPAPSHQRGAVGLEVALRAVELSCRHTELQGTSPGQGHQRGWLEEGATLWVCLPVPYSMQGEEEENISVMANQAVTLQCPARGSRWLKDGDWLRPTPGLQLSAEGTVLQVHLSECCRGGEKGL